MQKAEDPLILSLRIDPDRGEIVRDLIAQDALNKIEVMVDERRTLRRL